MLVEEYGRLRRNLCRGCGRREIEEESLHCDSCKERTESAVPA